MAKKVADQLVDTLEKAGVRRIYAVTGDSLNEVNEAVRKNGRQKNRAISYPISFKKYYIFLQTVLSLPL